VNLSSALVNQNQLVELVVVTNESRGLPIDALANLEANDPGKWNHLAKSSPSQLDHTTGRVNRHLPKKASIESQYEHRQSQSHKWCQHHRKPRIAEDNAEQQERPNAQKQNEEEPEETGAHFERTTDTIRDELVRDGVAGPSMPWDWACRNFGRRGQHAHSPFSSSLNPQCVQFRTV